MGSNTTASGTASTSMGYRTTASGQYSLAMGREIEAGGDYSVAIALSDQNGANLTQNNAMAIMGGYVGINQLNPGTTYRLYVNGEAACSGSAPCWNEISDISFKEDITPLEYGLEEVMLLQPKRYVYKETGEEGIGLIAQDVELIVPEVVTGENGSMTIGYTGLVPVLINSVQDLERENEDLRQEVSELKELVCLDHPDAEVCD